MSVWSGSSSGESIADILNDKALVALQYGIKKADEAIQEIDDSVTMLDDHLKLTFEEDYIERIMLTSEKLDLVRQETGALAEEFERLSQINPTTADMASELQSRMEEIANQMRENIQEMRELTLELAQIRMDAIVDTGQETYARLKRGYNAIANSLKALSGQGLMGLNFNVLPVIPKDVIEQQREINDKLIAEEKRYQEASQEIHRALETGAGYGNCGKGI